MANSQDIQTLANPSIQHATPPAAPTLIEESREAPEATGYSTTRRYVLLTTFCAAQFLDSFNISALFSAIPAMVKSMDMSEGETTWIVSAYQLTFAAFLLIVSQYVCTIARCGC